MCYDGALVMPNNYAVVNEEEMTYVDGGATYFSPDDCNRLAAACSGASIIAGGVASVLGLIAILCPDLLAKSTAALLTGSAAILQFGFGMYSAFFWYASARGGVTFSLSSKPIEFKY